MELRTVPAVISTPIEKVRARSPSAMVPNLYVHLSPSSPQVQRIPLGTDRRLTPRTRAHLIVFFVPELVDDAIRRVRCCPVLLSPQFAVHGTGSERDVNGHKQDGGE
ncbi:hypothetical protein KC349_g128 [Hortaea werneckii]|nr:hypothetical protein KC349_g128 [Hortaea werneckii]